MKKKGVFAAFLTIMVSSLVSAGPVDGIEQLLEGLGEVIVILIQFSGDTLLDINSFDEFLFAKMIFFILIFLVIYVIIDKNEFFGDNKSINKIITASISILAVRFIPDELVSVLFLQYGALGAGLGMIIPFFIILFFLHQSNWGPLGRKIGWIFYGSSYVAIFAYSYTDLIGIANYVYWVGILAIMVAFFFDRQIHAAFGTAEMKNARRGFESTRYADIQHRIDNISRDLAAGGLPSSVRANLEKQKKHFEKQLLKIMKSL